MDLYKGLSRQIEKDYGNIQYLFTTPIIHSGYELWLIDRRFQLEEGFEYLLEVEEGIYKKYKFNRRVDGPWMKVDPKVLLYYKSDQRK